MDLKQRVLTVVLAIPLALLSGTAGVAAQQASPAPPAEVANPCQSVGSGVPGGGGANNIVFVHNTTGGNLRVDGSVQINHAPGPDVGPVNCAAALGGAPGFLIAPAPGLGCSGCQTVAVALQIDLISFTARRIVPRNIAAAENLSCQQCVTVAVAAQYVLQVADPTQVPPDADALGRAMNRQLRTLQSDHSLTPDRAAQQIVSVIQQFTSLAGELDLQQQRATN